MVYHCRMRLILLRLVFGGALVATAQGCDDGTGASGGFVPPGGDDVDSGMGDDPGSDGGTPSGVADETILKFSNYMRDGHPTLFPDAHSQERIGFLVHPLGEPPTLLGWASKFAAFDVHGGRLIVEYRRDLNLLTTSGPMLAVPDVFQVGIGESAMTDGSGRPTPLWPGAHEAFGAGRSNDEPLSSCEGEWVIGPETGEVYTECEGVYETESGGEFTTDGQIRVMGHGGFYLTLREGPMDHPDGSRVGTPHVGSVGNIDGRPSVFVTIPSVQKYWTEGIVRIADGRSQEEGFVILGTLPGGGYDLWTIRYEDGVMAQVDSYEVNEDETSAGNCRLAQDLAMWCGKTRYWLGTDEMSAGSEEVSRHGGTWISDVKPWHPN